MSDCDLYGRTSIRGNTKQCYKDVIWLFRRWKWRRFLFPRAILSRVYLYIKIMNISEFPTRYLMGLMVHSYREFLLSDLYLGVDVCSGHSRRNLSRWRYECNGILFIFEMNPEPFSIIINCDETSYSRISRLSGGEEKHGWSDLFKKSRHNDTWTASDGGKSVWTYEFLRQENTL